MAPKAKPDKPAPETLQLPIDGVRVVSVFGALASRTLVEMSTELATRLLGEPLSASGGSNVVEAVERDIDAIRQRSAELAESGFAASAVALAYEIEHPYNSATSKSMCARALRETLDRLLELAPAAKESDGVDDLASRREERRAGSAAAADSSRP